MPEDRAVEYRIRVAETLASRWDGWFDGLAVSRETAGGTLISGRVADQSALHGLLSRVRDLGLTLVLVERIEPGNDHASDRENDDVR